MTPRMTWRLKKMTPRMEDGDAPGDMEAAEDDIPDEIKAEEGDITDVAEMGSRSPQTRV